MVLSQSKLERFQQLLSEATPDARTPGLRLEPDPVPGGGISDDTLWVYAVVPDTQWNDELPRALRPFRGALTDRLNEAGLMDSEDWLMLVVIPESEWQVVKAGPGAVDAS